MKMKFCIGVAIVLVPVVLMAAGFALSEIGTRGLSMGGAYRSLADDWSSIYWNPAGLAEVEGNEISFVSGFLGPMASYVPHTSIPGYDGGYPMRYRVNAKSQLFILPQIGYVTNLDFLRDTKFGLAIYTPFGLGASWDLYDPPLGFYERDYEPEKKFPQHDWESKINVTCAYLGIARKFGPLSIGIAGGPCFGKVNLRRVRLFDIADMDTSAYSMPIQFRYLPIDTRIEVDGVSYGLNFGIKLDLFKALRIGIAARYYSPMQLKGNMDAEIYFPKNSSLEEMMDSTRKFLFQGGTLGMNADVATEFSLPLSVGGGISYTIGEFTFAFDAEWTRWSNFDVIPLDLEGVDFFGQPIRDDTLTQNWRDTWRYSFGIAYRGGERTTIRLGGYYDENAVPKTTLTPLIPDINTKVSVNVGVTYEITERLTIDFNYEFLRASQKEVASFADVDNDGEPDNMPGKYSMSIDAAGVGISYRF